MNYRIHVTNTDQTIDCPERTTILVAAVNAGIDFPYGCASGNCGLCMCKVGDGQFEMLPYADGALGPVQEARGPDARLPCDATLAPQCVVAGEAELRLTAYFTHSTAEKSSWNVAHF